MFQKICEALEIPDERNIVSIPAIDLFAFTIKAIKDHFEKAAKGRGLTFTSDNILYVLTVPAIWSESAKEFMKKAAMKVKIFLHNQDARGILHSHPIHIIGAAVTQFLKCSNRMSKIG